jgi:hypothetical protein
MRVFVTLLLLAQLQSPSAPNQQKGESQKQADEGQRISIPSPVTVNVNQSPSQPQKASSQANPNNWPQIVAEWALVLIAAITALAGFKNLKAIESQVNEMRKTGEQTDKLIKENIAQSGSLEKSVAESSRAATAMEGVAKSLESTAKVSSETLQGFRMQMRAYLTVIVGGGIPQDRESNLKFDARPQLVNAGPTPARNVRYRIKAAILPIPLPEDFDDTIAIEQEIGGNTMAAHQNAHMMGVVEDYVPDDQIEDIKIGKGPGVYVWGIVTYEDVFGENHTTAFCQRLTWLTDGNVFGYYIPGRNDAD